MRTSAAARASTPEGVASVLTLLALARVVPFVVQRIPLGAVSLAVFSLVLVATIVATRVRPAYGIAALLVCDPFAYAHHLAFTTITLEKVALVGVAIGLFSRRTSLAPLRSPASRALVAGAIAIAVATALTAIPGVYIDAVARETLKALEYLGLFTVAMLARASDDADDDRPLWVVLGGVVAVVCVAAIVQEFTIAPAGVVVAGHVIPRVAGLLEGPNQLAGFLDIALPLLFARALVTRDRASVAVLALALLADILTLSRAGAIGAFVGLATVAIRLAEPRLRRPLAIAAGAIATLTIAILVRIGGLKRLFSTSDIDTASGLGSRAELWSAAIGFWRSNPILGIGAGNFELDLPQVGLIGVRTHANSLYLQSLAEGGIVLFAATLWTIVAALRLCLIRAPREALYIGVGAATLALAVHQILDFLTFFPKVGGFWWIWLGIAAGALVRRERAAVVRP